MSKTDSISEFDRMFLDENLSEDTYEEYQKGAAEGDPFALSELGNIELMNGFYHHDEERRLKGIHYMEEAAARGEKSTATFLGFCYQNGNYGFPQDIKKALAWFKRGAELGDIIGLEAYVRVLQSCEDEEIKAAAENTDDSECGTYLDGGLTEETYEILETAARAGKPVALYEYGMVHVILGFKKDDINSIFDGMHYLKIAVSRGNGAAAAFIGTIFQEGKYGYDKNMEQAVLWYKKGAELGDPLAMSNYAIALQHGDGGLQRDDAEAFRWLKTAADKGLGIAQYNAALALHAGRGVRIDRRLAKKYFQMAAENGIAMANMWLYSEDYKDI